MGYRKVYKNRDIRFECANYCFKDGHCHATMMWYDDGNGNDVPAWPIGCSGDPKCKNFKPQEKKVNDSRTTKKD